jgi:photosystem II stability/assembly factor-like uncharacterized protein
MGGSAPARRRLLLLAGIVALDVVLISVALRPRPAADVAGASATAASADVSAAVIPTTKATVVPPAGRAAVLVDLAGATAVRVTTPGTCAAGGAAVQVSTDAGTTWTDVDVPVRTVLRVRVTGAGTAALIGAGGDCRPAAYQTTDAGRSWPRAGDTAGMWHRYGRSAARLHTPAADVALPCPGGVALTDLAPGSPTVATVLCADGSVHRTTNGGTRWERRGEVPGAVAVNQSSAARLVAAVTGSARCAGIEIRTSTDGGAIWTVTGCAADAPAEGGAGLTFGDPERGLLVAGTATYRTADGGATWTST